MMGTEEWTRCRTTHALLDMGGGRGAALFQKLLSPSCLTCELGDRGALGDGNSSP